ncbi:MAG: hypothetical protein R3Y11_05955 [Pseudomonadota bacterium]
MADGSSGSTWISTLFSTTLYTINVQDTGDTEASAFDSSKIYSTDAIYTVELSEYAETLPLALLYCMFEIALSDVAAHKAENYMAKIEANQELQAAASVAIAAGEALQEEVYATTSAFISANDDWVTTADWTPTHNAGTNYDTAFGASLIAFLEDSDYVGVSGDVTASYVFTSDGNTAVWTLTGFSALDEDGNVYELTVTYTVQRATAEDNVTTPFVVDGGTFIIASGDTAATTNVLTTTLNSDTDADIISACELADITEIDGVTIEAGATLTSDQLATLIEELELAQENASSSTQTDMVYAEEYLGQYNSYLTGSSSTLDDYSSSLMSIAGRI